MASASGTSVIVVGGGIGGLAAALSLAAHGRQVLVLERAAEFAEMGAGIQLAPNALRVLRELGVLDLALADAVRPVRAVLMEARSGEQLAEMDFGDQFRTTFGAPYVVTHRSDLLASLVTACRASELITLENSRHVVGLEQIGDDVVVTCADGSRHAAGVVIGADGLRSVCREYVLGDGPPICSGDVAYRGTVPVTRIPYGGSEPVITWWIGPQTHLIQYPVRGGELLNQVGVFTSDAYRNGMDPESPDWGTPDELDGRFSGLHEHVRSSIALLNRDRRWALFDRAPASTWTRGRVTLLGDAAHPMLQYLAQGGCQALEDAFAIGASLAAPSADVTTALDRYERLRRPRAALAQTWARRVGDIVHADGLLALLRDALLRRLEAADFRYVDWLYRDGPVG